MKRCHCALTVDRRTLQKGTHTQKQMVNAQPPAVKQNNEQLHSNQSVQGGTLHMGSICRKVHQLPQNTHSEGQYSSGAMERYTWVRFAGHWRKCRRGFKRRALCTPDTYPPVMFNPINSAGSLCPCGAGHGHERNHRRHYISQQPKLVRGYLADTRVAPSHCTGEHY